MKFLRLGNKGDEKPAILDKDGKIRDLSSQIKDFSPEFLNNSTINKLKNLNLNDLPELSNKDRIGSCIKNPGKFVAIGLNYTDHAKETGLKTPTEPIVFMKASSSICGPNDDIEIPKGSTKLDWEVELAFVVGKQTKNISENDATDHILGYCIVNDVSEREFQIDRGGTWDKGKSCDTFGPIGPYLVTRDEVEDPQNLNLWLELNGQRVQDGNTNTMIHKVFFTISYLSQFMSLQPGDIISTGTPPGVGSGMNPPTYLKAGDSMKLGIEGLGEQSQDVA